MTQKVLRVLGHQTHILFTLGRIDHTATEFLTCTFSNFGFSPIEEFVVVIGM